MKQSKRFRLNVYDFLKGVFMFFLTSLSDVVLQAVILAQENKEFNFNYSEMLKIACCATVAYLIKQFTTGEKKEKQLEKDVRNPLIKP